MNFTFLIFSSKSSVVRIDSYLLLCFRLESRLLTID